MQTHQKSALFVAIGIFLNEGFKFQPYICNECHDIFMMSMNLNNIAILKSHGVDYRCIINRISKRPYT